MPTQIGTATTWASASAGFYHVIARRTDGTIWAWGDNFANKLGGVTAFDRQRVPAQIGSAASWVFATAGHNHNFAIRSDGTLWGWGHNGGAQLGDGTAVNRAVPTQIGGATNWSSVTGGNFHTIARKTDATRWVAGYNANGQLGDGNIVPVLTLAQAGTDSNWLAISAGALHSVAIKSDGTLWTWGQNVDGQLGDGTRVDRTVPVNVP